MRLIDADKLDQFLENAEIEAHHKRKYVLEGAINTLHGNIRTFPAIEPERKTGKWEHYGDPEWLRDDGKPVFILCSECNNFVLNNASNNWNYCPNCGAKMEEDDGK